MDSTYRPQSPDISSYAPQSPDLSGLRPQTPEITGSLFPASAPGFGHRHTRSREHLQPSFGLPPISHQGAPTSVPLYPQHQPQQLHQQQFDMAGSRYAGGDEDEYMPAAARTHRVQRVPQSHQPLQQPYGQDTAMFGGQQTPSTAPPQGMPSQPADPTLGVQLKTSFPVARIKRIMQADEDIGKVAQVTPHVVSRALELFMIKLISASAAQARGPTPAGVGRGKGPQRILAQHMKRAVASDETLDFLQDIVSKVPDAPSKAKKEAGSDSEDAMSSSKAPKKRGKKRKDSGDDF